MSQRQEKQARKAERKKLWEEKEKVAAAAREAEVVQRGQEQGGQLSIKVAIAKTKKKKNHRRERRLEAQKAKADKDGSNELFEEGDHEYIRRFGDRVRAGEWHTL